MSKWRDKLTYFLSLNLAQLETTSKNRWWRAGLRYLRVVLHVGRGVASKHSQRAAALTFTSLLSLVPLVAVVFSLFKAFGGVEQAQGYLLDYIAPNSQDDVAAWFEKFISSFNASTVGAVGMTFLFITVISTLVNIEEAFNQIWALRHKRSWGARLIVYWSLITIGPVLIGASLGLTASVQNNAALAWFMSNVPLFGVFKAFVPILLTTAAFSTLYLVMPAARVTFKAAVAGGFAGALIFELAKVLYAVYAAKTISNNPLYGSLAAIPVFIVWMNYSWRVVLFGAEISHAVQYLSTDPSEETDPRTNQATREEAAVRMCAVVSEAFVDGRAPPSVSFVSARLLLPLHLAETLCFHLVTHGVLREVVDKEGRSGLVPGRSLDRLSVADVIRVLRYSIGVSHWAVADDAGDEIDTLLLDVERDSTAQYKAMTFLELAKLGKPKGFSERANSKAAVLAASVNEVEEDGPQATSDSVSATRVRSAKGG